ncbi:hypothetical protein Tco_0004160 [Tanacetum coccineum]
MVMTYADHVDIADLQGCSSLIDQWLPCRLLQGFIQVPPDSCMILSSALIRVMSTLDDFGGNLDCQHGIGHVRGVGLRIVKVLDVCGRSNEVTEVGLWSWREIDGEDVQCFKLWGEGLGC